MRPVGLVLLALLSPGCGDRCKRLDERLCRDLGSDCAHWMRGIGNDPLTCDIVLADRGYYDNALAEARRNARKGKLRPTSCPGSKASSSSR